jgi:hypothetical protein
MRFGRAGTDRNLELALEGNVRKVLCVLAIAGALSCAHGIHAQAAVNACPATKTIDELIAAIDAAVSGPADKDRTCMRKLFVVDARLVPLVKSPDGKLVPKTLTLDDWITRVKVHGSEAFYEKQINYTSDVYGQIAHVWSTYETRSAPDGKPLARGINSIQAVNDGSGWKVEQILWETESPAEPLPEQYLPKTHE